MGNVQPIALGALGVITVLSVGLWFLGAPLQPSVHRQARARPPLTWMFRDTGDPELEGSRRLALGLLPIFLIALGGVPQPGRLHQSRASIRSAALTRSSREAPRRPCRSPTRDASRASGSE